MNQIINNFLLTGNNFMPELHLKQLEKIDEKIQNTNGLVTTTVLDTKISEVENKILDTSSLVTTTVLNTKIGEVENKIPDYPKYVTTQEFNKLSAENFAARLRQAI